MNTHTDTLKGCERLLTRPTKVSVHDGLFVLYFQLIPEISWLFVLYNPSNELVVYS